MCKRLLLAFLASLGLSSAWADEQQSPAPAASATLEEASAALGLITGAQLGVSKQGVVLESFRTGLREAYGRQLRPEELKAAQEQSNVFPKPQQQGAPQSGAPTVVKADLRAASYQFGLLTGARLKEQELKKLDFEQFALGLERGYTQTISSPEIAKQSILLKAYRRQQRLTGAEETLRRSKAFLQENARRAGVVVTKSGLQYEILKVGTGPKPTALDTVTVNYRHSKPDGRLIYDSAEQGHSETLAMRGAIPAGWREGFLLMKRGSRYRFYLPPDIGFGLEGSGDDLLPNEVLVTEFELIDIIEPPAVVGPQLNGLQTSAGE